MEKRFRHLEINGGLVTAAEGWRLQLPPTAQHYSDAQIDDYGRPSHHRQWCRRHYPWRPGTEMSLQARFSHGVGDLVGTAGFGFWNAPFGDPTIRRPALPQATWFFYGSRPTDLPLAPQGPGRDWFAATLDAATMKAWSLIPLAPMVVLLNHLPAFRRRFWPWVQRRLGISYAQIRLDLTQWHRYRLTWLPGGCTFYVDGVPILQTPFRPQGPLGFVCWLDNQYMVVTPNGRWRWGVLPILTPQWLEISELSVGPYPGEMVSG